MGMNTFSVFVLLYDILFIALIDTGSSISAVSQEIWMQISHLASVELDPAGRSVFQTTSGTPLQADGTFYSTYLFGNDVYPHKTYVMDNVLHPVILVRDMHYLDISSNIRQQSKFRRTPRPHLLFKWN